MALKVADADRLVRVRGWCRGRAGTGCRNCAHGPSCLYGYAERISGAQVASGNRACGVDGVAERQSRSCSSGNWGGASCDADCSIGCDSGDTRTGNTTCHCREMEREHEIYDTDTCRWTHDYTEPELIRRFPLARRMTEFGFFSYESHEALHLSDHERQTVSATVRRIKEEYSQNIDAHSPELIVSNLELLLNDCKRYYARQFATRTCANRDVVIRFEAFLTSYFGSGLSEKEGVLSVQRCAREMGYSPNYLSDLLKKETGKSTREHIHHTLVERAKNLLLGSEDTVAQIAYSLGFEYPQHFSKLFKSLTGVSPAEYRN